MTSGRQIGGDMIALGIGTALIAGAAALLLKPPPPRRVPVLTNPNIKAARDLNRAAGMLAFSVLADSAVEHYRGSFHNKAMWTPLAVSGLSLMVSGHGMADHRPIAHRVRDIVYLLTAVTGAVGTGFHIYNVAKEPGGFRWENLFYGAPLGAPSAIGLSGLLGYMAERARDTARRSRLFGGRMGRATAAIASAGLIGTMGEAALLHFRGAFHNPFMATPVVLPPLAAGALAVAAVDARPRPRPLTRWLLRLTAAMGFAGVGFHAYGVQRAMGGWRNWRQTVVDGPPLPAPPSFTGLALAGLAALALMQGEHDA